MICEENSRKLISRQDAIRLGLNHYFTGIPCPRGHIAERVTSQKGCVACNKIFHKDFKRQRATSMRGWLLNALSHARQRKEWDFNISAEDVSIPSCCPYFKREFIMGDFAWGPSLDRRDTSLGYVKGNVEIISRKANRMKNDGTLDDLIEIGRAAHAIKFNSDPVYRAACGGSLLEMAGFSLPK